MSQAITDLEQHVILIVGSDKCVRLCQKCSGSSTNQHRQHLSAPSCNKLESRKLETVRCHENATEAPTN